MSREPSNIAAEDRSGVEPLMLLQGAFRCGTRGPKFLYIDMAHRGLTGGGQ